LAVPTYTGSTYADYGEGGIPGAPSSNPYGYYIWSNNLERTSWSVRWTGKHYSTTAWNNWFGSIEIVGGSGLTSHTDILFEGGHPDETTVSGEIINWVGWAGPHYDGFDFIISENVDEISFALGNDSWPEDQLGLDALGWNIFIGQNHITPNVMISSGVGGVTQNFEIPVHANPEPTTMLLFGSGLIGLAGFRRKFKKS